MMKKFFFLICAILISLPVMATTDYTKMCPALPQQKMVTPSKITGVKWLTEQIAEGIIKKELKKETKGKYKVTIKSRGTGDLINGKFYSLSMNGKNLNIDGTHISKFSSETLCGYNSVELKKDSIKFRENMVLKYELEINNDAISQTLIDTGYVSSLKKILPVNDARMEIRNNKVYHILEIPMYVTKPLKITVSSGLNVKNGRIHLTGLNIPNNPLISTSKIKSALEKTSPFAFYSDIMDNKESKVYVDSVKIINDIILIKGLVLLPKNIES